jgi:DNA-binding MarR family transcriptional regulator
MSTSELCIAVIRRIELGRALDLEACNVDFLRKQVMQAYDGAHGPFENPMKTRSSKGDTRSASPAEIAGRLKLDKGLGFLVRLLDTRVNVLYERLTAQNDITPRQFGVLLTLYQQGTLTLTELARHIRVDRSTLGEMINRMAKRSLISKRNSGSDGRSAEVMLAPAGQAVVLKLVTGAAELQTALLAPLAAGDRAHFMRCMKRVAEPEPPGGDD